MQRNREQEIAYYCLRCIKRVKMTRDGKYLELNGKEIELKPESFSEFEKFRFYDGIKREIYEEFERKYKNRKKGEDISKEDFYKNYKPEYPDYVSDYLSFAKRLPQLIVFNGLIPTLAYCKSKKKAKGQIYTDLSEILERIGFEDYRNWKGEGTKLLEFLIEMDSRILYLATEQALEVANWLKRLAEAEHEEE